jgi:hypothetical protein
MESSGRCEQARVNERAATFGASPIQVSRPAARQEILMSIYTTMQEIPWSALEPDIAAPYFAAIGASRQSKRCKEWCIVCGVSGGSEESGRKYLTTKSMMLPRLKMIEPQ